jgi:hypothetical protein
VTRSLGYYRLPSGRGLNGCREASLVASDANPLIEMRRLAGTAYYVAHALTVGLVLFYSLQLWRKDLNVPFGVTGDSLFWTVVVEATYEDGWGRQVSRLGMPVGADLLDWPMGMPLDFGVMSVLRSLLGTPGAALNVYWLLSLVVAGITATLCLRWLGLAPPLAFGLGALYGLLPYGFGHSTAHIPLVFHFIPLIAFLAIRVGEGHPEKLDRGQRLTALAASLLQGLSYIYYSFFSCILLGAAALLGWVRTGRARTARTAVLAIGLICSATLIGLAPSLRYWQLHGRNPELSYKMPAEADTLGLRIRHLLTPIPDHPIPVFRRLAEAVEAAHFPGEGENVWSRLGTVGGLGFVLLLGFSVGRVAGGFAESSSVLRSAAALTLVALLVAQVGGFGSLFSLFVAPDIRAYSRIVVFIAFFSLVAVGIALSSLTSRWATRHPERRGVWGIGVAAVLLLFCFDQVSTSHLTAQYDENARRYGQERAFVARVESVLPRGGMVLQLPHTDIPVEVRPRRPMELYDHGWAFVHSRSLRWSWGGIRGRNGDWAREVAFLPPDELVGRAARAGFDGIWIDRFGYADRGAWLVPRLAEAAGSAPMESRDGRFALVSLVGLQRHLQAELRSEERARIREEALAVPLVPRWGTGCEEQPEIPNERWCGPTARLFLKNTLDIERRVTLEALLKGPPSRPLTITSSRFETTLRLSQGGVPWEERFVLSPGERLRIDLSLSAEAENESRFQVSDLRVSDRRARGQ